MNKRSSLGLLLALCIAFVGTPLGAQGTDSAREARAMLQSTVEQALAILSDDQLEPQARHDRVVALAEERFDFLLISRFVVARDWRRFSPEQREEFVAEFKRHLAATYGDQLGAFSDEKVEFGGARLEKNGDVTGATRVIGGAAGDGVDIAYRMREREGSWYVIDVIIAGVSMVQNFRAQVRELLQNSTPDELIEKLREKNASRAEAA